MDNNSYYLDQLYPLQDKFLRFFESVNQGHFYLTGGTALSRFYWDQRFSDDLDFFTCKELHNFRPLLARIFDAAKVENITIKTETVTDQFLRAFVIANGVELKIDFVNDSVFHWGDFNKFKLFSSVDNEMNILANKITCISRYEAKDVADIWALASHRMFMWRDIFVIADKKSPVAPLEVSRIIKEMPLDELNYIKWSQKLDLAKIHVDLQIIADDILLGRINSLTKK